jgi:hypothetical protein
LFEVLEGRVGFRLDGREEVTGRGRRLVVEPATVHDFWNAGEQEAHVLVQVRPGRRSVLAPIGRARGYRAIDPRYLALARRRPVG